MRKEDKLIILLARLSIGEEQMNEIREIIQEGIAWDYFVFNCFFSKVNNLVYSNLIKAKVIEKIQYRILTIFRSQFIYSSQKLSILKRELYKITNIFNQHDIPYAIIKGFILTEKIYGSIDSFYRDFNDIDILITESDITKVSGILAENGFVQGSFNRHYDLLKIASREDKIAMKISSHQIFPYIKKIELGNDYKIVDILEMDINFTIFEGGNIVPLIATDELLKHTEKIFVGGTAYINSLNENDLFIQLAYHLYKDTRYNIMKENLDDLSLLKFCDVREFIHKYRNSLDWGYLINYINEYNLNESMYFVLFFCDYIYGDLLIDDILLAIKPTEQIFLNQIGIYKESIFKRLFKSDFNKHLNT